MQRISPLARIAIIIAAAFLGLVCGLLVAQGNAFAATPNESNDQASRATAKTDKSTAKKPTKPKVIVIDAGHQVRADTSTEPLAPGSSQRKIKDGGGTVGCVTRVPEYKLNLQVAKRLRTELTKRGYRVIMVRTTNNVHLGNIQRAKVANKAKADAFVRIHANAASGSSARGALTIAPASSKYVGAKVFKRSKLLSQKVLKHLCKKTGAKDCGVMYTNTMTGINWSKVPVTIVEMGFMTNPAEDRKMAKPSYQKKIAAGIADGLDAYFKALKKS